MRARAAETMQFSDDLSFPHLITRDAKRLAAGIVAQLVGGFGVMFILGRYLSPKPMAIYMLFWIAQTYATTIFSGWLQNSAIRFLPENPSYLFQFMIFSYFTILIVGTIGIVLTVVIGSGENEKLHWTYMIWTVAILCFASLFSIFQSIFRGVFEQKYFSIGAILLVLGKVALLFLLLSNVRNDPITKALMAMAMSYFVVVTLQWLKLQRLLRFQKPKVLTRDSRGSLLKKSLTYGMPQTLSLLLITVLHTGDKYILATLVPLRDVGIYAFWMSIGLQTGRGIVGFVLAILSPRLFQVYSLDPERAKTYVRYLLGFYIVTVPLCLGILGFLLPSVFTVLKIHPEYGPESHMIFYGLGMAFFLGLAQLTGKKWEFIGKTILFVYASIVGVITMGVGTFVLTPLLGLDGAATATLGGFVFFYLFIFFGSQAWKDFTSLLNHARKWRLERGVKREDE